MSSKIFNLNLNDFTKGLIMAVLSGTLVVIYTSFTSSCGVMCIDWMLALNTGIGAGLAYLIKNFFTDNEGKLGGKI